MTKNFRMSYLKAIYPRYRKASKAIKAKILDEFCRVCGYHRKYAISKLRSWPKPTHPKTTPARSRPKVYDSAVLRIVTAIWEAANYPWSARLKAILRLWLPWIKKHFPLTPEIENKLLRISPSTIDRCLKERKNKLKRRLYGRTKPGTLLKHHIPIKTDHWDVKRPGFVEVDLVSHSGNSASGEFLYSLNLTDIYSSWVQTRAVMGKGETGVLKALQQIRQTLPFKLLGIDSDNGSEFLNHHLWRYCQQEKIQFTRSRPYKKDDNAHIEQKNWTHVRKLLGWDRYDSLQALQAINDLYQNELGLFMNLYQPSVRLLKTTRIGSKLKRLYDKPQTPLDRLIASKFADPTKLSQLTALRKSIDPFDLSQMVNRKLDQIWHLAHRRFQPPKLSQNAPQWTEGLSPLEQQTLKQVSKSFAFQRYLKNKKGKLLTFNQGKILT